MLEPQYIYLLYWLALYSLKHLNKDFLGWAAHHTEKLKMLLSDISHLLLPNHSISVPF